MADSNKHDAEVAVEEVVEKETTKRWYELSLIQALSVAIIAALLIVGVAVKLYTNNENHKYDINRPGSDYNSPKLMINENTDIDTSSPVNKQTLDQTNKIITEQLKKLAPYGNYKDPALENDTLGLTKAKDSAKSNY